MKNAPRKREEIYLSSGEDEDDQKSLESPVGLYLKSLEPQTYDQKPQICDQPILESQDYDQMLVDMPITTNIQTVLETETSSATLNKNEKKRNENRNEEMPNVQISGPSQTRQEIMNLEIDEDKMFLLSLLSSFKRTPDYKKASTKIELIQLIENIQYDEDKMFLNSLLSSFKKIPEEKKAQAKIELIQVIERAQCSNIFIKVESQTETSWESGL